MNELSKALSDIRRIRQQVVESTEFRGYGPATVAGTGLLAAIAAVGQSRWLPDPASHHCAYLGHWIGTAAVAVALISIEMYARTRRMQFGMADAMIRRAVEQFLPAVAAGILLTVAVVRYVPGSFRMLPGLWQVIFSLGVFASCRFLPRPMIAVGAWYLITGLVLISLADDRAISSWAMGIPYGVGQALVAMILLWGSKRREDAI
jgi:hypothetical protein